MHVSLSLFATGFPVTPPEPGPAPSQASGFRPSGLLTPVSPGVPTGARNLGICVFTCFAPNPCYRLSAFSLHHSVTALSLSLFPATLCYRPPYFRLLLLLTHPRVSLAYFLRTPRILRVTRWDLRRRWVMLTVCTETELVPTCVLSPPLLSKILPSSFTLYSSLPTYNNTA